MAAVIKHQDAFRIGPNRSVLVPPCSLVSETSDQVPTSSLAVWATASSAGRITPKIIMKGKMRCFMVLLWLWVVVCARDGARIATGGVYHHSRQLVTKICCFYHKDSVSLC